jgi:Zn-dependent alcohol dehydrogenase
VSERIRLDQVGDAFATMRQADRLRSVIVFD